MFDDEKFEPAGITVSANTTVTFHNISRNAPHSAKAEDGSFDTGYIMPGATGQVTVPKAGEYQYFCEPHPYKKGIIKVQQPGPGWDAPRTVGDNGLRPS